APPLNASPVSGPHLWRLSGSIPVYRSAALDTKLRRSSRPDATLALKPASAAPAAARSAPSAPWFLPGPAGTKAAVEASVVPACRHQNRDEPDDPATKALTTVPPPKGCRLLTVSEMPLPG